MENENKMLKFQNLLIYFFGCSVLGWILEVIFCYFVFGEFINRGFLYGPLCPIYGCGAAFIVLMAEYIKKKDVNVVIKFIILTSGFALLEYFASFILELIFNYRWWDYTNEFLNLNGRICLKFSLMFGIMGTLFIKFIYNPSKRLVNRIREKISTKVIWIIIIISMIIIIVDFVLSVLRYV